MSSVIGRRRYLTNFETHRLPHLYTDVLVLGGGVAGLSAAISASAHADVLVCVKDTLTHSATSWAQGGIAVVNQPGDSFESHIADTLQVACGLGHPDVVRRVVEAAPGALRRLLGWGARFDQSGAALAAGREGGHTAARIAHAEGDATGREIVRTLIEQVHRCPRIRVFEHCFAIDLLTSDGAVVGVVTYNPKYGHQMFWASTTILATGGAGRVFRETTNPAISTGDGFAMAFRAGVPLRDMEMVQFHPTTLYVAGAARALITEAVRGEGAYLLNRAGRRFMLDYSPQAELAPRDLVSRAITSEMRNERAACVYLDVRHFAPGRFAERFPTIHQLCRDFDIDPGRDLIPVRPSAHYTVGGLATDLHGRTALPGLLASGECAASGMHGANRLASNSLLEGLVFGDAAGAFAATQLGNGARSARPRSVSHLLPQSSRTELDLEDVLHSLRALMSRNVAIERSADRLRETIEIIEFWSRYVMDKVFDTPAAWETQNLLTVALCIATAAATRAESRGVHFRSDAPASDQRWHCHIDLRRTDEGIQVSTAGVG